MNHFYYGSVINSIDASGKTVEEVKGQMTSDLQAYTLNLEERGGKSEQITAVDIGLRYNSDVAAQSFKNTQNPVKWISAFFSKEDSNITEGFTFDKELLKEKLDKSSCFDSSTVVEPKDAGIKYADSGYVIVDEINGNKVNKDILYEHVVNAILKEEATIDLESIDCYIKPQYTSSSQNIIDAKNLLNKYVNSNITYTFGEGIEILDASIINQWLKVDEKFIVTFDEEKAKDYINVLSNNYNTIGRTRNFVTSLGKTIGISGGDYGWWINSAKETEDLIAAIKNGETITKEPSYTQTALSRNKSDIGNTYVEIDLSKQHLWFYKNGGLVVEGDVVTGNVSLNHTTPGGIYRLKYKQKDAVLRGEDYASPVNFWMPFNGGIGLHDASWRSEFGGNIYQTNGSHGCVNAPYNLASAVFNVIVAGNPVVCYY